MYNKKDAVFGVLGSKVSSAELSCQRVFEFLERPTLSDFDFDWQASVGRLGS